MNQNSMKASSESTFLHYYQETSVKDVTSDELFDFLALSLQVKEQKKNYSLVNEIIIAESSSLI